MGGKCSLFGFLLSFLKLRWRQFVVTTAAKIFDIPLGLGGGGRVLADSGDLVRYVCGEGRVGVRR